MLVITDCSGSMAPYGSEVLLWHLLRTDKDDVSKFAFFNDGEKESTEIGNAGGIHFTSIKDYRKIGRAIRYFTELGYDKNNDHPENDLEAIIKSVNSSYSHEDVVVIVDNNSPVRDMELLNRINYPTDLRKLKNLKKTILLLLQKDKPLSTGRSHPYLRLTKPS